jgi:hypothetical protein
LVIRAKGTGYNTDAHNKKTWKRGGHYPQEIHNHLHSQEVDNFPHKHYYKITCLLFNKNFRWERPGRQGHN